VLDIVVVVVVEAWSGLLIIWAIACCGICNNLVVVINDEENINNAKIIRKYDILALALRIHSYQLVVCT